MSTTIHELEAAESDLEAAKATLKARKLSTS
jgi:hypothetical protein